MGGGRGSVERLSHLRHDLLRRLHVLLGVEFRHGQRLVPENDGPAAIEQPFRSRAPRTLRLLFGVGQQPRRH